MPDEIISLTDGESAVIGFGLLLARGTVERTLGRPYDGPFVPCHIAGWRRSWDVSMPNAAFYYEQGGVRIYPERILYLNARRDPEATMNCVAFVVGEDDLSIFNAREWIYDRLVVTTDLRGVQIEGGDALMYVGKPEHVLVRPASPRDFGLRRSYVRMLDSVLESVEPAIRANYQDSTDPVPEHLLFDDSLDPERPNPWEAAGHGFRPEPPTEGAD